MKHFCLSVFISLVLLSSHLAGAIVRVNGTWSNEKYVPTLSVSEHFDLGTKYLSENKWKDALQNFLVIIIHYPSSPYCPDAIFNAGSCYFFLGDNDLSNQYFTKYLNEGGNLKYFEKAFDFKFQIAERYSKGSKKHMFGVKQLPRLQSGKEEAMALYDEVIAALPSKEIAAKALYGKAAMQRAKREFRESIESLQTITRRFPKSSFSADAFLQISEIYLQQSKIESQNPDLLSLAQINFSRFQKSFPGDERMEKAGGNLLKMKEAFAKSLFETGRFYEKKKKPGASKIYYCEAIKRYPETTYAEKSRSRIALIEKDMKAMPIAKK